MLAKLSKKNSLSSLQFHPKQLTLRQLNKTNSIILKNKIMSLLSKNVIPGNHGRIFGTNAKENQDLLDIKNKLLELDGIKDVVLDTAIFPREFTVYTTKILSIDTIEKMVKSVGFHAIPK